MHSAGDSQASKKWTLEDRQKVVQLYKDGLSDREIGLIIGRSPQAVSHVRSQEGLSLADRTGVLSKVGIRVRRRDQQKLDRARAMQDVEAEKKIIKRISAAAHKGKLKRYIRYPAPAWDQEHIKASCWLMLVDLAKAGHKPGVGELQEDPDQGHFIRPAMVPISDRMSMTGSQFSDDIAVNRRRS